MPDVSRSDSQRSDASQRPRVSFNRDVHVKRISTVASPRPPVEGGSLRLPVRRRLSRREGVAEARRALQQADQVACSASLLDLGDGFRSLRLPARGRKARPLASTTASSTSLTDLSAQPDRPKRRKEANGSTGSRGGSKLKRSQSERSSERPRRDPISAAFHSLERKRHKSKAQPEDSKEKELEQDQQLTEEDTPISPPRRRHHSANSDRSPSPRPRKNILKKSLSDSEAKPEEATAQPPSKKQLSPIIEDAPRAGYDFSADAPAPDTPTVAMHSSQAPADRPPVTRGRTVETLVRRLSQETLNHKNKKPPRGLSPSALVAPGEDRRHNNNLPFSYTEPPPAAAHGDRSTAAASAGVEGQQQVIYAEVVVGGGGSGKQTVHTQVPQRAAPPPQADAAAADDDDDEVDEGVGLSMDYGARNQLATDFRRANGFHSESRETAERTLPGGGKASTARREFAYSGVSPDGAYKKEYLVQESSSRYESADLGLERGRADGMDSRRKDFLAERYDDGEHLFDPRPRKSFDLDDPRLYKDSLDGGDFYGRETPVIHDLSSRRDRLESRIESQRKERFSSYNKRDLSESVKKYATDPPRKASAEPRRYSNRRDFLASQIDLDDEVDDNVRYENDRNRRKSAASTRYLDLSTTSSTTKKDFFADSGIEVDYRSKEPRRYDDVQTVEGPSAKIFIGGAGGRGSSSSPSSTNVTRVELRTGATPTTTPTPAATPTPALASDAEDDPRPGRHFYSSRTATATAANFSATRLVQERHRGGDVLPASTVLIRHYAAAEDRSREPSPKHRDREFPDPSPKHRDREFLDPSPKHNDREYRDPSPKHREREYREPSPKQRDREYLDPSPKHREREYRDPSPKHRDREYRDRDKDRERERDRDRDRVRDLDRERASRESRERRERHEHSAITSTSTASRTLSRTQREQRASEKLIRVERLAHGPEASDIDLDLDGRHSALDDTDVDERHYQRRRREDDDEDLRSRRKKPSKKAPDLREEEEEQEDVRESEAEESRRADTIKRGGTLRAEDQQRKKGPAPAPPKKDKDKKKQGSSAMDKVKQLFTGSSKKDKKKKKEKGQKEEADRKREEGQEEEEDPVAARYTEYRGDRLLDTDEETLRATPHSTRRGNTTDAELSSQTLKREQVSGSRQRLATPSPAATPSPGVLRHTRDRDRDREAGWFKSLDRLTNKSHGHTRARDKSDMETTDAGVTEDEASPRHHSTPGGGGGKSLRFFGDTDAESVISIPPPAAPLSRRYKTNSALQASSKTLQVPTSSGAPSSGTLKAGNERRHHRSAGDVATSSAESTTEGDSSQQSQRSVVYLHAATVGDIPGPRSHATARRAQSREELSSVTSSQLQPQTKTISRSISVLAPWRPKHAREALEVHYTNEDNNRNYIKNGRPPKAPSSGSQHRQPPAGSGATTSRAVSRRRSGGADAASKIHAKQKVAKATSIESLSHKNGASGGVRHTLEMRNSAKKRAAGSSSLGPAGSVESLSRHSDHSNARLRGKDRSSGSGKNSALNASAVELSTADTNGRGYKSSTHKKDTDRAKDSGKVSRSASMPKDTRVTAGWFKLRNKKQGT